MEESAALLSYWRLFLHFALLWSVKQVGGKSVQRFERFDFYACMLSDGKYMRISSDISI